MLHTVCNVRQNVRVKLWILIGRKKIVEFWLVCCFLLSISTSGHLFQLVWLERGLLCSRILKWPWRVFLCVSILQANLLHSEKLHKNNCNLNRSNISATQNCDIFSCRCNLLRNNDAAFLKLCQRRVAKCCIFIWVAKSYIFCIFISVMIIFSFQWSAKFAILNLTFIHMPELNGVICDVITCNVMHYNVFVHYKMDIFYDVMMYWHFRS